MINLLLLQKVPEGMLLSLIVGASELLESIIGPHIRAIIRTQIRHSTTLKSLQPLQKMILSLVTPITTVIVTI
jgi:hypothetical protein